MKNLCSHNQNLVSLAKSHLKIADPCQPRWRLEVDDLVLIRKDFHRAEDKKESSLNLLKISN